jgi:CRP-like cAMP-binding protein
MPPVIMIDSGKVEIVFTTIEGEEVSVYELRAGDFVGVSQLLQVTGFEYFGKIRALSTVECFVIENPDSVFELYERNLLKARLQNHTSNLKHILGQKYPYLPEHPDLFLKL